MQTIHHQTPVSLPYRLVPSAALAMGITIGLFLIMQALIHNELKLEEEPAIDIGTVVMDPPPEPETLRDPKVEPVPEPAVQPEVEMEEFATDPTLEGGMAFVSPRPHMDQGKIGASTYSGVVPIIRVEAVYPSRAITREIEGYVDLMFDITATGKTTNIRVLVSEPKGYFEKAAIRALEKWKYKPPMEDGVAYAQPDMMTRMTFALENQ